MRYLLMIIGIGLLVPCLYYTSNAMDKNRSAAKAQAAEADLAAKAAAGSTGKTMGGGGAMPGMPGGAGAAVTPPPVPVDKNRPSFSARLLKERNAFATQAAAYGVGGLVFLIGGLAMGNKRKESADIPADQNIDPTDETDEQDSENS